MTTTAQERRFTPGRVEVRSRADKRSIGGYAAVFNKQSRNLGGFIETVNPGFFNKSRGDGWPDVMARYNHDDNMLLGTTASGMLRLTVDEFGLDYEVTPPDARADIVELVDRGDVNKSSFAFRVFEDDWALNEQGFPHRSLVSGQLVDVAPVNSPAYLDTTAGLRSLATTMGAELEEIRRLAEDDPQDGLKRFFIRTDNRGKPIEKAKQKTLGAAALVLLQSKRDITQED
jgi:HK97 family phage prohead protease